MTGRNAPDSNNESPSARQTARRLIESRQPEQEESDGRAWTVGAVCNDLYRGLSRWVGRDGCHALFTRALAETQTGSAALNQIHLHPGAEPYIDGVAESIVSQGDPMVAEALESMLVHLVELLERLIGGSMAKKLIERSFAAPGQGDATSNDRREEA